MTFYDIFFVFTSIINSIINKYNYNYTAGLDLHLIIEFIT